MGSIESRKRVPTDTVDCHGVALVGFQVLAAEGLPKTARASNISDTDEGLHISSSPSSFWRLRPHVLASTTLANP